MEKRLSASISNIISVENQKDFQIEISSNMEWLLTWAIKQSDFPEKMWCDGVVDLFFTSIENRKYIFNAKVWIGPESDVGHQYQCKMSGSVILSQDSKDLQRYEFIIYDKGKTHTISR